MEDRIKVLEEKLEFLVSRRFYDNYTGVGKSSLMYLEQLIPIIDWYKKNSYKLGWVFDSLERRVLKLESSEIQKVEKLKKKWYEYLKFWTWFKRKPKTIIVHRYDCDCDYSKNDDDIYKGIFS